MFQSKLIDMTGTTIKLYDIIKLEKLSGQELENLAHEWGIKPGGMTRNEIFYAILDAQEFYAKQLVR
jgi:hypothetical protein